jgi:hypothetical protein
MSSGDLRNIAPLLDAYLAYFERKRSPFTVPGHKQNASRLDAGLVKLSSPTKFSHEQRNLPQISGVLTLRDFQLVDLLMQIRL